MRKGQRPQKSTIEEILLLKYCFPAECSKCVRTRNMTKCHTRPHNLGYTPKALEDQNSEIYSLLVSLCEVKLSPHIFSTRRPRQHNCDGIFALLTILPLSSENRTGPTFRKKQYFAHTSFVLRCSDIIAVERKQKVEKNGEYNFQVRLYVSVVSIDTAIS